MICPWTFPCAEGDWHGHPDGDYAPGGKGQVRANHCGVCEIGWVLETGLAMEICQVPERLLYACACQEMMLPWHALVPAAAMLEWEVREGLGELEPDLQGLPLMAHPVQDPGQKPPQHVQACDDVAPSCPCPCLGAENPA